MSINIDFSSDWKSHLLNQISSGGYKINPADDICSISYKFFNIHRREVSSAKRNIHESTTFQCPPEHQAGYNALKSKIESGINVNPHLSKSLLNTNYEDALLNDWGIHHFHLGENAEKSGFIERTGPLLFAFVTPTDFYCINIFPHGAWSEQDLIKTLHDNWPNAIEKFRINGVISLTHTPSNQNIATLRKAGIQTMIEVSPGIIYGPMGGGYSTAGTSVQATMQSDYHSRLIRNIEKHVIENIDLYISKIEELGLKSSSPPEFKLLVDEAGFHAYETGSRVSFLVHPHNRG